MGRAVPDTARSRAREAALIVCIAALVVTAGCPGGTRARVARARTTFERIMGEGPEYRKYAIEIAADSSSPFARKVVLDAIQDENFQIALTAVRALGENPPEEAREPLTQVFVNRRGAVKLQAAVELARLGDGDAIAYLRDQIADPAQLLSVPAVSVVAARDGEEFLEPILAERMKSESQAERDEVYAALGEIHEPWATRLLLQGLANERGEARKQAIMALGRTGDPAVAPEIERFVNTQGLVFATLQALGALGSPTSVGAVRTMADNEEGTVRAYAAVALWRLGQKDEALGIIDPLVEKGDSTTKSVLAEQLEAVDDPDAWELLATLSRDADKSVRIAAIRSLGAEPRVEFEPTLLQATGDSEYEVCALALNVLAEIGSGDAVEAIAPLMQSDNGYVALAACHAVMAIDGRQRAV